MPEAAAPLAGAFAQIEDVPVAAHFFGHGVTQRFAYRRHHHFGAGRDVRIGGNLALRRSRNGGRGGSSSRCRRCRFRGLFGGGLRRGNGIGAFAVLQQHGDGRVDLDALGASSDQNLADHAFIDGLASVGSSQAHFARRRAAILLMADPADGKGSETGWSEHFRTGLRSLPAPHREAWQHLVLEMKASELYVAPAVWHRPAAELIATLSPRLALEQIDRWVTIEGPRRLLTVRTIGGSQRVLVTSLEALRVVN